MCDNVTLMNIVTLWYFWDLTVTDGNLRIAENTDFNGISIGAYTTRSSLGESLWDFALGRLLPPEATNSPTRVHFCTIMNMQICNRLLFRQWHCRQPATGIWVYFRGKDRSRIHDPDLDHVRIVNNLGVLQCFCRNYIFFGLKRK